MESPPNHRTRSGRLGELLVAEGVRRLKGGRPAVGGRDLEKDGVDGRLLNGAHQRSGDPGIRPTTIRMFRYVRRGQPPESGSPRVAQTPPGPSGGASRLLREAPTSLAPSPLAARVRSRRSYSVPRARTSRQTDPQRHRTEHRCAPTALSALGSQHEVRAEIPSCAVLGADRWRTYRSPLEPHFWPATA